MNTNPPPSVASEVPRPVLPPEIAKTLDLLADKTLYPLSLDAARETLKPVVDLHRESPTPAVVLMIGSGPGGRKIEISYVKTADGRWQFSALAAVFTATSSEQIPALFHQIESYLRKKLGKPRFNIRRDTPLPQIAWRVKRPFELWLTEEANPRPDGSAPEREVHIEVSEPTGEAD